MVNKMSHGMCHFARQAQRLFVTESVLVCMVQEFTRKMPITISGSSEFLARVSDNDVQEQFLAEVQRTVSRKSLLQGFLT